MAEAEIENPRKSLVQRFIPRRKRWRFFVSLALLLLIGVVVGWSEREQIADNIIADQLDAMGLPATYDIESIAPDRQSLTNIVIGDTEQPDLTIERATVFLRYRLGTPAIGRVEVEGARLYGSYRDGTLSFGSLDPVLFAESDAPPGLPDLDLKLVDGRALIETDWGPVGVKAEGEGELDDGFAGSLAAIAPELAGEGCRADDATLFGSISTAGGEPRFIGPVRLGRLDCPDMALALRDAAVQLDASSSAAFDSFEGEAELATGALAYDTTRADGVSGRIRAGWADGGLNATFALAGEQVAVTQAALATLSVDGAYRAREGFARSEIEADVEGTGLRLGPSVDAALAGAVSASQGTLAEPVLRQIRAALEREERGSRFAATLTVRQTGGVTNLVVPAAELRGGSGASLLSLSRVQLSTAGSGPPRFAGNLQTGGQGLPRIAGRMERRPGGDAVFRLRMAEYAAGSSSIAMPEMVVAQSDGGTLGFAGTVVASGPLPGGSAQNLRLPVRGNWSERGGLALWRRCTEIGFDRLALAALELDNRSVTLCPSPAGAIVRYDGSGLRIAAGMPALDLSGRLAGTPIRIASGPIGFAWPGAMSARDIDVSLGPAGTASRFRISDLDAQLGGEAIEGTFSDADVRLDAVPLNVLEAAGTWSYAGDVLTLADGRFVLEDREAEDRFEPLVARGASLTLEDNVIRALATLRAPESDREVTDVAILHDLSTGAGHADLAVDGLVFDRALQPDELSQLALGVIANARGTVTGTGRIDWSEDAITSSGEFSTDGLDFAAAFGPVKGARGTIRFSDLLSLTTAPGQTLTVGSVNPGIEVLDGEVEFALRDGQLLSVAGASWPFMGGRLILESTNLNFAVSEERRYVFRIVGLEAAQFVERMELGNISATGVFDGVVPIVFDEAGNGRIEGGALDSRPPGGNVSYVGELTYEDLSAMANFAFDSLRSLDYDTMAIRMDGPLTGEIVTRVRFDGVSQGEGADRNFITREIAKLPLRFNVNIRAPFYQLITSIKAMYDPAFVRDPRELGLVDEQGERIEREVRPPPDAIRPEDIIPDEPPIQTQESESMP